MVADREQRVWSHSSKETDGGWWRHGRKWWHASDYMLGIEFLTLKRARFGGFRFKLGGKHSENFAAGMIGLPRVATLYWEMQAPRRLHSRLPDKSHVTAVEVSNLDGNPSVGWTIWKHDDMSWRKSDKWWQRRSKTLYLKRLLWGKPTRTTTVLEGPTRVDVPMPEGKYPATVKIEKTVSRFRFGRTITRVGYDLEFDDNGYIPVPGKGTTSYNCGPDGVFGMSGPGRHIEDAVADVIRSALRDRRRYGGGYDYADKISE